MRVVSIRRVLLSLSLLYLAFLTAGCGSSGDDGVSAAFKVRSVAVTDLGTLGGGYSKAIKVNDSGQITGESTTATGDTHAFIWQNGVMADLGTLGGNYSRAADINDLGQIVGESTTAAGITHAFIWQNGVMTDLGTLTVSSDSSTARAINKHGQVVGYSWDAAGATKGFIWQNGAMTDLGTLGGNTYAADINDSGVVTGTSLTSFLPHVFIWKAGVMTDIGPTNPEFSYFSSGVAINNKDAVLFNFNPDTSENWAGFWQNGIWTRIPTEGGIDIAGLGINDQGQVTGAYKDYDPDEGFRIRAFLWQNGVMTLLPVSKEGVGSEGFAINDKGQVVGNMGSHAAFWYNGTLTDLGAIDPTRFSETYAYAINNHGQVVGMSKAPGGEDLAYHATLWTIN